jgi:hypothetical protein
MLTAAMQQTGPLTDSQVLWLIVAFVCAFTLMYLYLTGIE